MRIRTHHFARISLVEEWLAYFDGREEWLVGRGPTESEAVADLLQQVWESGERAA